ncbi:MAG TPA: hypothetical protein VKL40_16240, partial [Candidatus Angelobacter sp.]|nr:hypothetical protein [Candidatus Angelobacter sp.]
MKTSNKIILGGMAAGVLLAGTAAGLGAAFAGRHLYNRLQRRRSHWLGYGWSGEDLRGQTVLITGSSRGLGLALAEQFAREGCNLV